MLPSCCVPRARRHACSLPTPTLTRLPAPNPRAPHACRVGRAPHRGGLRSSWSFPPAVGEGPGEARRPTWGAAARAQPTQPDHDGLLLRRCRRLAACAGLHLLGHLLGERPLGDRGVVLAAREPPSLLRPLLGMRPLATQHARHRRRARTAHRARALEAAEPELGPAQPQRLAQLACSGAGLGLGRGSR